MKGKPIPSFSLTLTDKSKTVINNESLKGKIFLIDFWAQWGEQSLHDKEAIYKIYEKYKAREFTVLSLSMDSTFQQYSAFLKRKGKYPWMNAYIGCRTDTGVAATFQIVTIPKRFLIDTEGKLLAMGEGLSVEKLEEILKNYIK
jgi:peroxiredoxin